MLVEHGAKVGIRDSFGRTALHDAAMLGHLDTVRVLAARAKIDVIDGLGWSALHFAACLGHLEVIRVLVRDFGADVDSIVPMIYGSQPPLHVAAGSGQHEAVRLLGKLGANVSFPSGLFTPVYTAAQN